MAHYDSGGNLEFFPAIVGGVLAREGEFPAHVSIQTTPDSHHLCGGTLIDLDYVSISKIKTLEDGLTLLHTQLCVN